MRLLIVTDAWLPQVNGVVTSSGHWWPSWRKWGTGSA